MKQEDVVIFCNGKYLTIDKGAPKWTKDVMMSIIFTMDGVKLFIEKYDNFFRGLEIEFIPVKTILK